MSKSDLQKPRPGVVAVVKRHDRFLVIERSQFVPAPGKLCFPGGGVEHGESEPQALRRELREELNCDVLPREPLWQSTTSWNVALVWWSAELHHAARLEPDPAEVANVFWMTTEEMRAAPNLLDSNRDFLDAWESGAFALD